MPAKRSDLNALKRMLSEVDRLLKSKPIPEARLTELITASRKLTNELLAQTPDVPLERLGASLRNGDRSISSRALLGEETKAGERSRKKNH
jgi:hypothetical protein